MKSFAWLAAGLLLCAAAPAMAQGQPTLVILHTNDIHGHLHPWRGWEGELAGRTVGGLDRLAARVREVREEAGEARVLLLDAGDALGDTLVAAAGEGRAVVEAMNAMRYDAMTIGNHEPDFGVEALRSRMREARFPVLAANLETEDGQPFARPFVVREVGGVRVGILGLAYPNTPLTTAPKNVAGLRFRDAAASAREVVPRLRREGAELVVALTHLGLAADIALAREVPGIDVIVGGHSHNRMREALRVGQTLIVQAGAHGSDLGRLDLTLRDGRIAGHRSTLLPVTGDRGDAAVAEVIERASAPLRERMRAPVGRTHTPLVRAQTLSGGEPARRDAESPADSLFADAIREATGADIGFLPGVGYGVAIPAGTIEAEALRNLIPHDAPVWTMTLDGAQVRSVLEQSIENLVAEDPAQRVGGMIQVSGLAFRYDPARPAGERIVEAAVAGEPLDARRRYTIAVNGLLAEGGHKYAAFAEGREKRRRGDQYEMVRDWIARHAPVSAPEPGRIARVRTLSPPRLNAGAAPAAPAPRATTAAPPGPPA